MSGGGRFGYFGNSAAFHRSHSALETRWSFGKHPLDYFVLMGVELVNYLIQVAWFFQGKFNYFFRECLPLKYHMNKIGNPYGNLFRPLSGARDKSNSLFSFAQGSLKDLWAQDILSFVPTLFLRWHDQFSHCHLQKGGCSQSKGERLLPVVSHEPISGYFQLKNTG